MDNPSPVPVEDKDTKEIRDQTTDRLLYSYDKSHGCFVSADTGEPVCHRLVVRDPKTLEPKHVHTMVVDMAPVLLLPMFASERIGEARRNILVTGMKELVQKSYEGYEQLLRDYPDHHLERVPITEHIVVTTSDHKTQENMADVVHVDDADVYKTDGGPISSNTKRARLGVKDPALGATSFVIDNPHTASRSIPASYNPRWRTDEPAAFGYKDALRLDMIGHVYYKGRYTSSSSGISVLETWQESDLADNAFLTTVFAEIKIRKVRWRAFPGCNLQNATVYNLNLIFPNVYTAFGAYGASPPGVLSNQLTKEPSFRVHNRFKPWQRTIVPSAKAFVDTASGLATSMLHGRYATQSSAGVKWYGLYVTIEPVSGVNVVPVWDVWGTYYMSYRFGNY